MKKYKHKASFSFEGSRYYVYADSPLELGRKIEQKTHELKQESKTIGGDILFSDWAKKCIDIYKPNQSDITRKFFNYRVEHCILKEMGSMKLEDIRPLHCQEIMNLLIGKSHSHINAVYQALNFMLEKAVDNNLLDKNPAKNITRPKGTKQHRRALTSNERAHFISVGSTDRRFYVFLLMLFCGCRPSEASNCKGKDISKISGYHMLHIRGTKTANANRFVPIPHELYRLIKDTPASEYIAVSRTGHQITPDNRRNAWKYYLRNINISMGAKLVRNAIVGPRPLADDLVPYCLRHEYCTNLARQGIDIRTAQKLMGHSDIALTANIYTNLNNEDIVAAAKILSVDSIGNDSHGVPDVVPIL